MDQRPVDFISKHLDLLDQLFSRIGDCFLRAEPRLKAQQYVDGLLGDVQRRNTWQLAEYAGEQTPDCFQRLLYSAKWDEAEVAKRVARFAYEQLRDGSTDALIFDETGFIKKGKHSAGVQRQYTGTTGKRDNCQIGVFAAYTSARGHCLVDRELYLPKSWCSDRERCRKAKIPDEIPFRTKPEQAAIMFRRLREIGFRPDWVLADCVYSGAELREQFEAAQQPYVLAVAVNDYLPVNGQKRQVSSMIRQTSPCNWMRISAGDGAKGDRWYDWTWQPLGHPDKPGWTRGMLLRRSIKNADDIQAYITFAPEGTGRTQYIKAAGMRWPIEECFEEAKGQVGLAQYEVMHYHSWYRHITLVMLAYTFLVAGCAEERKKATTKDVSETGSASPSTSSDDYCAA